MSERENLKAETIDAFKQSLGPNSRFTDRELAAAMMLAESRLRVGESQRVRAIEDTLDTLLPRKSSAIKFHAAQWFVEYMHSRGY